MSALEESLAFQIRAINLPEPVREFVFAPPRRFRADFCWPHKMLIVEVDGGTWNGGRHTRGTGFDNDCEKGAIAMLLGYRVLHVTGTHIKSGAALEWIEALLQ